MINSMSEIIFLVHCMFFFLYLHEISDWYSSFKFILGFKEERKL